MSVLTPILTTLTRMVPIGLRDQAVLAEALSQALAGGMETDDAFTVAAITLRSWRMRRQLRETRSYLRTGQPLLHCIIMAGMPLHPDLRAAFDVGEERGHLETELAAAARRLDPLIDRRFAAAVGRSPAVNPFATTLARLLAENPLTIRLVRDAARLVGRQNKRFWRAIDQAAEDMDCGGSFADALARQPGVFDALFVRCVGRADSREGLRRILSRLGGEPGGAMAPRRD